MVPSKSIDKSGTIFEWSEDREIKRRVGEGGIAGMPASSRAIGVIFGG
jgi:hypothetical protein